MNQSFRRNLFVFACFAPLFLATAGSPAGAQQDPTRLLPPPAGPGPGPGMMVRHRKAFLPPLPPLDLHGDTQVLDPGTRAFALDGNGHVKGGDELDLYADHISGDLGLGLLDATGNVRIREFDTTIEGKAIHFDSKSRSGLIAESVVFRPPYTLITRLVTIDRDTLVARDATITNTPPGMRPLFWVHATRITISQLKSTISIRNASFYFHGTRLFTIRSLDRSLLPAEKGGLNDTLKQRVGYDSDDGPFFAVAGGFALLGQPMRLNTVIAAKGLRSTGISTQITLVHEPPTPKFATPAAENVVRTLRELSAPLGLPLQANDPLRFHNFLSTGTFDTLNAQPMRGPLVTTGFAAIYDDRLLGRRIGDLLVSRYPEINMAATIPLGRLRPDLPTMIDPAGLREVLARPDIVARIIGQYGYYQEFPSRASGFREALVASVESRPVLIGPNTLLHPIIDFATNQYPGQKTSYHYLQSDIGIEHLYSNRTAVGLEYIKSLQSGHSPFVFDTLDVADELDVFAQYGAKRWILGGRIQYDFATRDVYDYQITAGPDMGSFVPTIGYDQRSSSLNVGFSLAGLDF